MFAWDAGLVRDGCFFAGYLAASVEGDTIDFPTDNRDEEHARGRSSMNVEDGVTLCLTALAEMKWSFSKSEEREETVRMVWENKKFGRNGGRYSANANAHATRLVHPGSQDSYSHFDLPPVVFGKAMSQAFAPISGPERPLLPPLHLLCSPRRVESAPNTAYTTTGHGSASGWPSYTPPRTATSVTTSAGTGVSGRETPEFTGLTGPVSFKSDPHEFSYVHQDLDQFSFNVPTTGQGINDPTHAPGAHYHHRDPPSSSHSLHSASTSTYLDSGVFAAQGSSMVHAASDVPSCPQFGDSCHGFYH